MNVSMITKWSRQPKAFGAIAFGLMGLLYGVFQVLPIHRPAPYLVDDLWLQVFWCLLYGIGTAATGWILGTGFVERATQGRFFRASGFAVLGLMAASAAVLVIYCLALIVTGDFGMSLGIFGSFQPDGLLQKLVGTLMVFFAGLIGVLLSAAFVGFVCGFVVALVFDQDY